MKKTSIIMLAGILQFTVAGSTLTQKIEQDRECKASLSKDYKTASKRELQCKTLHILAQKLEHSSYRSMDRIINLEKAQRVVKKMKNANDIGWILKQEIKKNSNKLVGLIWPKANLCYFDVEVNSKKITFLYATNRNNTINIDKIEEKLSKSEIGNSVQICSERKSCITINSNEIKLPYGKKFNKLKILTSKGSMTYDFKQIHYKNLIKIAYEINAQLFNRTLPPLSTVKVSVAQAPKPKSKPVQSTQSEEYHESGIVKAPI
jgi:hypothetical protein